MKGLLLSVLVTGMFAQAQEITEVRGETYKLITLKSFNTSTYKTEAVAYSETNSTGTAIQIWETSTTEGTKYYYSIQAQNGQTVATHEIPQNKYLRLRSIFRTGEKSLRYDEAKKELVADCPVEVSIQRADLTIYRVYPTCDDL